MDRVEDLAREENQLKMVDRMPLFEWWDGNLVEDDYDDGRLLLNINDLINDEGDTDSDYAPYDIDEDDVDEQIQ